MRTTAAAALVVTSAAPLLPQPDLNEVFENTEEHNEIDPRRTQEYFSETDQDETSEEGAGIDTHFMKTSVENKANMVENYPNEKSLPPFPSDELVNFSENGGNSINTTAGNVASMFQTTGFASSSQPFDIAASTRRLAKELEEFVEKGLEGVLAAERGDPGAPSEETVAELQLQTARMLRQLLPTNRDLLHLVQERNWIPLLLGWLNLHDRPAVQVEALLALTNIAELCAQQSYYLHTSATAAAAASAAAANGMNIPSQGVEKALENFPNSIAGLDPATLAQNPYLFPSFPANYYLPQQGTNTSNCSSAKPSLSVNVTNFSNLMNSVLSPSPAPMTENNISSIRSNQSNNEFGNSDVDTQSNENHLNVGSNCDFKRKFQPSGSNLANSTNNRMSANSNSTGLIPSSESSHEMASLSNKGALSCGDASNSVISSTAPSFEWDARSAALPHSANSQNCQGSISAPNMFPPPQTSFPLSLPPLLVPTDPNSSAQVSQPSSTMFNSTTTVSPGIAAPNSSLSISNPNSSLFLPPVTQNSTSFMGGIPQPLSTSSQHLLLRHADAIPTLISLLSSPNKEIHEQAMWILGSIAAGESTSASTIPPSTASSGTGNSSNDSIASGLNEKNPNVSARDVLLAAGVMSPLLHCLDSSPQNLSLQRIGSWALSNLVEGRVQHQNKPGSSKDGSNKSGAPTCGNHHIGNEEIQIQSLLPTLRRLLHLADAEVLSYTCWTLSHLCDGPSSHIAAVVASPDSNQIPGGLVPRLVELLVHQSWRVTKPALRTIGNIVCAECGEDGNNNGTNGDHLESSGGPVPPTDYTEVILDCGAVPRLKQLISHGNREIQKEACWTLSNIAAGTVDQIQSVIDSGAIAPLVSLVNDCKTDQEVRSEACWVVLNATSCGSDQQIEVLVDEGCVSVLGVLLGEPSMVMMALEGLERVLQVEEGREISSRHKLAKLQQQGGSIVNGTDKSSSCTIVSASLIERALEKHNSPAVSKRAGRIWKQHFVSCALCRKPYSKHRPSDAHFCNECKCYVCSNCNCEVYHLSYQEELWAATEEKNEVSKKAKKNKKQKKKEKRKEKEKEKKAKRQEQKQVNTQKPPISNPQNNLKEQQQQPQQVKDADAERSRSSTVTSSSDIASAGVAPMTCSDSNVSPYHPNKPPVNEFDIVTSTSNNNIAQGNKKDSLLSSTKKTEDSGYNYNNIDGVKQNDEQLKGNGNNEMTNEPSEKIVGSRTAHGKKNKEKLDITSMNVVTDDDLDDVVNGCDEVDNNQDQPPIDFVLYLQQTGSIIALAKLMDALEYGDDGNLCGQDSDIYSTTNNILNRQATT